MNKKSLQSSVVLVGCLSVAKPWNTLFLGFYESLNVVNFIKCSKFYVRFRVVIVLVAFLVHTVFCITDFIYG